MRTYDLRPLVALNPAIESELDGAANADQRTVFGATNPRPNNPVILNGLARLPRELIGQIIDRKNLPDPADRVRVTEAARVFGEHHDVRAGALSTIKVRTWSHAPVQAFRKRYFDIYLDIASRLPRSVSAEALAYVSRNLITVSELKNPRGEGSSILRERTQKILMKAGALAFRDRETILSQIVECLPFESMSSILMEIDKLPASHRRLPLVAICDRIQSFRSTPAFRSETMFRDLFSRLEDLPVEEKRHALSSLFTAFHLIEDKIPEPSILKLLDSVDVLFETPSAPSVTEQGLAICESLDKLTPGILSEVVEQKIEEKMFALSVLVDSDFIPCDYLIKLWKTKNKFDEQNLTEYLRNVALKPISWIIDTARLLTAFEMAAPAHKVKIFKALVDCFAEYGVLSPSSAAASTCAEISVLIDLLKPISGSEKAEMFRYLMNSSFADEFSGGENTSARLIQYLQEEPSLLDFGESEGLWLQRLRSGRSEGKSFSYLKAILEIATEQPPRIPGMGIIQAMALAKKIGKLEYKIMLKDAAVLYKENRLDGVAAIEFCCEIGGLSDRDKQDVFAMVRALTSGSDSRAVPSSDRIAFFDVCARQRSAQSQ